MSLSKCYYTGAAIFLGFAVSRLYRGISRGFDEDTTFKLILFVVLSVSMCLIGLRVGKRAKSGTA